MNSFKDTGKTCGLALNSIGEGVYGMDLDGNVIFVNRAAEALLGYAADELIGAHSHEVFHYAKADGTPHPAGACNIYATALDGKTRRISEEVFWKKDGTPLPVEYIATPAKENGKIIGVFVSFRDITDRRRMEQEIRLLHEATKIISDAPDFQTALELVLRELGMSGGWAAGDAYSVAQGGRHLECAASWAAEPARMRVFMEASWNTIFHRGEALPGRVWESHNTEWIEDVTLDKTFLLAGAAQACGIKGAISVPILADGKFILALDFFSGSGIKKKTSFQSNFLPAIAAQLGARFKLKQAEGERKAAQEQLFRTQKLDSLGKLAGSIAHDFNNVLTVAKGFAALALETLSDAAPPAKYLRETLLNLDRGMGLTRQILAFSRNQPAEMRELDLNAVIAGMEPMLQIVFQRRIRLGLTLSNELPVIRGNRGQLEQILLNLAVNARDAMPGGGGFTIATLPDSVSAGRCPADYDAEEKAVRMTVADTGGGIPEALIPRIFEPYFTTKPEGEGTGLGLATVYSIVKLHKGGINVKSRPGQGTTFTICFPAIARRPAHEIRAVR